MSKYTVLSKLTSLDGEYSMRCNCAIIKQKQTGKKYYIADGFGGMDQLCGGMYRYRHGVMIGLLDSDEEGVEKFLEKMKNEMVNEYTTKLELMLEGYDDQRPIIDIEGVKIQAIANSLSI